MSYEEWPRRNDEAIPGDTTPDAESTEPMVDLAAAALLMIELGAEVLESDDIGVAALQYVSGGLPVFPVSRTTKRPAILSPHPESERGLCRGECGQDGHGFHDATTDLAKIIEWWSGRYRGYNIGARPPRGSMVLDIDDLLLLQRMQVRGLPKTLTTISGRSDGGVHLWFRRPSGKLSARTLPGADLRLFENGFVVAPPSVHPKTGRRYRWAWGRTEVAACPEWLADMLRGGEW
ncbi:bifunctional DNA primase/polymerase [Nocardia asiatica]|uniref:bifunctional DNA primase/polymerase n=1 Tax=Nocardia asiatica TaxID=209252 RepID=UPI002456FAC6|nr:bifunctional DNA primase/polymerase [Nocardia asiatica]